MQPANIVEGFRLSPQQRRLWTFREAPSSGVAAFCSQLVLSLEGPLRIERLRAALEEVCRRHEALRTTFRRLPGVVMPVQSAGELAPSWEARNLHGLDATRVEESLKRETETDRETERERLREFDYENGPLVFARLFSLEPERHLLSIAMPSLCADRRTLSNLFVELSNAYARASNAREDEGEPFQYVQFSEWQNSLFEEEDAEQGREYWAKQDLSATSVALPGQRAQAPKPGGRRSITVSLSTDQTTQIAAVVDQLHTSAGKVLLAAWQTLLWRLTQQSIVIGKMCDGRSYDLLHDAFGLFARVLPVCSQLNEGLRFAEVVQQIESFERESEEWQDYFDCNSSFSFGFEYAPHPHPWIQNHLRISIERQHCYSEFFDLKLTCVSQDPNLQLDFEFNTAAFDATYVRHLAERFQTLLDAAVANPHTAIEELEIVSAAERQQILFDWNNTKRDYSLDRCVHELFERQVERTPQAVAVVFENQQLTFAELNRRANQVARYLQAQGVGPESPVGICIEPSLEMIVAVLGALKSGGAYVPLDPRNPEPRIRQLTVDAGISILLTKAEVKSSASESGENFQTDTRPENVAYVIYTSGSTGQPKGVMVEHRSVVNLAAALRDEVYARVDHGHASRDEVYAGLRRQLKVGLSAPLAFDASVKQLVQILSGHTLYILPEELRLDAPRALEYLGRNAIDVLDCTPSQLKLLLAAGLNKDDGLNKHAKHTPKLMLVGGEALDESTWSQLAADQRTRFFNVYGPTECTVDATWTAVTNTETEPTSGPPQPTGSRSTPTIGRPIPNTRAYILDRNLKPAGIHLTGELYLGGAGLARGYLNSPERTAERFLPDHLSGEPGARLYRTADLARYAPDGSIIFSGRNDAQVKVRGHRVELGEIEAALRQHKHVREAVVVAREDKADVRLVGYVVAENGNAPETTELQRMLRERLPDYMLPSFLVVLDELPLTRNGKVDLKALPAPETVKTSRDENYVAPRNDIEAAITGVWQEALGVERIGVNDNFFDAGGHSLLMVQVHNKLSEMFEKNISIVEMFARPTIGALAEHFSATNGHKPAFEKVLDRAARRRQAASTKSVS
jgi:amino acid adenylation domain-containing protein